MISLIAAIGKNNELGKDNNLLWQLKNDMRYFKNTTINHTVIVGFNTFKSFPNGLKDRKMIVITDEMESDLEKNIFTTTDVEGLINKYKDSSEEVFVIGGAYVYSEFIDVANKIYLTEVDDSILDADVYFPIFNKDNYTCKVIDSGNENGINYQMRIYKKNN